MPDPVETLAEKIRARQADPVASLAAKIRSRGAAKHAQPAASGVADLRRSDDSPPAMSIGDVRREIFGDVPISAETKMRTIARLVPDFGEEEAVAEAIPMEHREAILGPLWKETLKEHGLESLTGVPVADRRPIERAMALRTAEVAYHGLFGDKTPDEVEEIVRRHEPTADAPASTGEKAAALGSSFVAGMNAPALGLARKMFGPGGFMEHRASMEAAENVADPARVSMGADRLAAVRADIASTGGGRLAQMAVDVAGVTPGLAHATRALSPLGRGAGPAALGLQSGFSEGSLEAAGGGVALAGVAGPISARLQSFLARLPANVRSAAFARLSSGGASGAGFAAADQILHGPDGERALHAFLVGFGQGAIHGDPLGKSVKATERAAAKAGVPFSEAVNARVGGGRVGAPEGVEVRVPEPPTPAAATPMPRLPILDVAEVPRAKTGPTGPEVVETVTRQAEVAGRANRALRGFEERTGLTTAPSAPAAAPKTETVAAAEAFKPEVTPGRGGSRTGQIGAVDPGAIASIPGRAARWTQSLLGRYSTRIRNLGTPSARELAEKMERAADVARREEGPLAESRVALDRAMTWHQGAARRLSANERVAGKNYALPRIEDLAAGRSQPASPGEAEIIRHVTAISEARGHAFERVGTRRERDGVVDPFKAHKGVIPRVFHGEGRDVIVRGPSDRGWRVLVEAIADANRVPTEVVERALTEQRAAMIGLEGTRGPNTGRESEAEMFREWRFMPSDIWVKTGLGERRIRILETNPSAWAKSMIRLGTSRIGAIEAGGQDIGGETPWGDLRRRFLDENQGKGVKPEVEWDRSMRLIHGLPFQERLVPASSAWAGVTRGFSDAVGLVKEAMLTTRAIANIPEVLGSVRDLTGNRGLLQTFWSRLTNKQRTRELEDTGVVTKEAFQAHFDPADPFGSITRAARQAMGTITAGRPIEQGQEVTAGHATAVITERMKARASEPGRTVAGERDVQRLKAKGFEEDVAQRLAYGKATDAEYDTMARTLMPRTMNANVRGADVSRVEHSRVSKGLLWFSGWGQMNARNSFRTVAAAASGLKRAVSGEGLSGADRLRRATASVRQLGEWALGRVVTQGAASLLASYAFGGTTGLKIAAEEAKDDFGKFLAESFLFGALGGPYTAILRQTAGKSDDSLSRKVASLSPALSLLSEITDAVQGEGRYMDKSGAERVGAILDRMFPVARVFDEGALGGSGLVGPASEGDKTEVAKRAYWRWRQDAMPVAPSRARDPSEFRSAIKRMIEAVEDGRMDDARRYREEAKKHQRGHESWGDAVVRRMLLRGADKKENHVLRDLLPRLRERIGEDAYRILEQRDARLRAFLGGR